MAMQFKTHPEFIGSKGWLDKFKQRYNLEFKKDNGKMTDD